MASSTTARCRRFSSRGPDAFSAANAMAYAGIVRDRARRRALVSLGGQIQRWAARGRRRGQTLLRLKRSSTLWTAARTLAGWAAARASIRLRGRIDRRYYGVAPQGCRPESPISTRCCMGCSRASSTSSPGGRAWGSRFSAWQFAAVSAAREGKSAAFFTAEMPSSEQVERLISSVGRIDLDALQTGALEADDWPRMTAAFATLSSARLWFDETPAPRLADIVSKARRLHRREGPLGLVGGGSRRAG
ncbi:MAG: hypothetical protein IPI57_14505 [Candidatus Competibacteraceae bacterium]|nr:hypothetical protein [Candidatus Competibacteraceae bacterium]